MDKINNRVIQILSLELGIAAEQIKTDSEFVKDLNADSIDTMNIINTINAQLHVKIYPKEAIHLKTVAHLTELVKKKTRR